MSIATLSRRIPGIARLALLMIPLTLIGAIALVASAEPARSQQQVVLSTLPSSTTSTTSSTTTTTTTTTQPKQHKGSTAPTPPPVTVAPTEDIWDRLAQCESGGNWAYNGASGFDGGLQFSPATWTRLHTHWGANTGYEFAWQAPREVQIQVAVLNMQVSSGTHSQWPVCSRKIGMPNKLK